MSARGALITKSADQTGLNITGGHFPTFDTVIYNTDNIVTSNQYFLIPSAYNGKYGLFCLCMSIEAATSGDSYHAWMAKNSGGTLFNGVAWNGVPMFGGILKGNGQSATAGWINLFTGPTLLTTNDRFEGTIQCLSDSSLTFKQESSFGLLVLDNMAAGYCTATLSADLTGVNYTTPTAIPWDGTDLLDTHGIHDPASNNTKFIVPAALNGKHAIIGANVYVSNIQSNLGCSVAIRMTPSGGGASLTYNGFGGLSAASAFGQAGAGSVRTQAIQVAAGDAFETVVWANDASTDILSLYSNMWMIVW